MTYDEWLAHPVIDRQRIGQSMMNTLPPHIYEFASGDLLLDCFYNSDQRVGNLILFAYLVWDVYDEDQLKEARQMIGGEM